MRRLGQFAARSLLVTTTALSASAIHSGAANAEIKTILLQVSGGKLKIAGTATPNAIISLDGGIAQAKARSTHVEQRRQPGGQGWILLTDLAGR